MHPTLALKLGLLVSLGVTLPVWGQSVALSGIMGSKALLVVDGNAPKGVAAGETHRGVKVLSVDPEQATIELGGQRQTLRLGEAPVRVGNGVARTSGGRRITLFADGQGHFISQGAINGQAMKFMVDTGATNVAISRTEADRMGLNYQSGRPVRMSTANGVTQGWQMQLASVRIGDVEVFDVEAVVITQTMPFVLLGNSYLTRFQMHRVNDQMVLDRVN